MAVDANVLIFERMKEELRMGRTLGAAIEAGFNRAWSAIRDSNVTTIIVCIILYWLGSSIVASAPVMGFALTLLIGVVVSMFTAILVTRTLLRLFVGGPLAKKTKLFSVDWGKK
jgi:preprotein translocase subunit SecD